MRQLSIFTVTGERRYGVVKTEVFCGVQVVGGTAGFGGNLNDGGRSTLWNPTLLTKWRKQLRQGPERAFSGNRKSSDEEARIAELDRMAGRLTMENDL